MSTSKICIVSMDNLKRIPYVAQYVRCISQPFDFVYWDRDGTDDDIGAVRNIPYRHAVRHGGSSPAQGIEKLTGYIGFNRFASRILRTNDYERVVCLTGNCAVLVHRVLLRKYPGRFVIDIRDYWHEDNRWYHETEQRLIESSALTVISSPAYREFLGNHDFRVLHNAQILTEEERAIAVHPHGVPMRIVCVGAAKNLEYDKAVIDFFANDARFTLAFRGRGYDALSGYMESSGIENIEVSGEFDFSETLEQYRDADAVLSMYGNGSPYWDYALANKLYFAAQLGLPIIVCKDTAMAEMVGLYDLGVAIDPFGSEREKDAIASFYDPGTIVARESGIARFLERVEADNERSLADIVRFFDC